MKRFWNALVCLVLAMTMLCMCVTASAEGVSTPSDMEESEYSALIKLLTGTAPVWVQAKGGAAVYESAGKGGEMGKLTGSANLVATAYNDGAETVGVYLAIDGEVYRAWVALEDVSSSGYSVVADAQLAKPGDPYPVKTEVITAPGFNWKNPPVIAEPVVEPEEEVAEVEEVTEPEEEVAEVEEVTEPEEEVAEVEEVTEPEEEVIEEEPEAEPLPLIVDATLQLPDKDVLEAGDVLVMTATIENYTVDDVTIVWCYSEDNGATWVELPNSNALEYEYVMQGNEPARLWAVDVNLK